MISSKRKKIGGGFISFSLKIDTLLMKQGKEIVTKADMSGL